MTVLLEPLTLVPDYLQDRVLEDGNGCWIWQRHIMENGYGLLSCRTADPDRRSYVAHRFVYEREVGPIPEGLELDHLCRVRACVRPIHLEPVTHAENLARTRLASCAKRGHPFNEANTGINATTGRRFCRACRRISNVRKPR